MNRRRQVRADLKAGASISGIDSNGSRFELACRCVDFSRSGLGLVTESSALSRGDRVSIELRGRLRGIAVVQWTRRDTSNGRVWLGVRLERVRTSLKFRVAACILLALAAVNQIGYSRPRWSIFSAASGSKTGCNLDAAQMKDIVDEALSRPNMITAAEKAFVRDQHERFSCEEYTRLFERSNYYKSRGKREAISKWHWGTFHARDRESAGTQTRCPDCPHDGSQ